MKTNIIPYEDPKSLSKFLSQPEVKIAELVTGALALGRPEAILMAGRLVQGAIKGNFMKQLGRELDFLTDKGKIKEDYAKEKYGFQTLSEILTYIDNESLDKDKFSAIKSLFYSIIDGTAPEQSVILRYQLFQICKKLTSSQLSILIAAYKIKDDLKETIGAGLWLEKIANIIGHNSTSLIERDEDFLEQEKLITLRKYSDRSGINHTNGRLTDSGLKLVEIISAYENFAQEE